MAFALSRLFVEIDAKTKPVESALDRIHGKLNGLTKAFNGIGATIAAAFAVEKITSGIRTVVDASIDMESRMATLRKVTGLQGDALASLRKEIEGLASTMSGVSLADLLGIAEMGGRLGIASDKIGGFVKNIGMIKIALDDIPAEEAATSIARILNVMQMGPEKAINFASALNKLDDSSTATGRDILDITQRIAASAATLGLAPQKVLALAAALKDAGAENEVAGSAMSQLFMKMASDTDKFAKVAHMSTADFADLLRRDALGAVVALSEGLKRFEKLEQFKALEALGLDGVRTSGTLMQLGTVIGKLNGYVGTANGEWTSLASITAEVQAQGETTSAQFQRLGNIFTVTFAKIGDFALPALKALATGFGELAADVQAALSRNSATIQGFADFITSMAKKVGLVFREWPTFVELARLEIAEKLMQVGAVFSRLGEQIMANLKWLSAAFPGFVVGLINGAADLGSKAAISLGERLAAGLVTGLLGQLGGIGGPVAGALAKSMGIGVKDLGAAAKAKSEAPKAPGGIGAAPGFNLGALFKDLPNLDAKKDPLLGRLAAARQKQDQLALARAFLQRPDVGAALGKARDVAMGALGIKPAEEAKGAAGSEKFGAEERKRKAAEWWQNMEARNAAAEEAAEEKEAEKEQPKAKFGGLEEFAKSLQLGAAEKNDSWERTAEGIQVLKELFEENNRLQRQILQKPNGPGYAT